MLLSVICKHFLSNVCIVVHEISQFKYVSQHVLIGIYLKGTALHKIMQTPV